MLHKYSGANISEWGRAIQFLYTMHYSEDLKMQIMLGKWCTKLLWTDTVFPSTYIIITHKANISETCVLGKGCVHACMRYVCFRDGCVCRPIDVPSYLFLKPHL